MRLPARVSTLTVATALADFHWKPYIHRMLKIIDTVKPWEVRAVDAVRDLLLNVPSVHVESVEYERTIDGGYGMDGLVAFSHAGNNYGLVVEVKSNGAPRFVRSGVYRLESCVTRMRRSGEANAGRRLIPMLVSSYLSPESRAICLDHETAYLDLVGNARLAFDTVYIDRAVPERPVSETRALRSIFTPKAAAILRVLLREPGRAWRIADLAAHAHASYGHVSNVRKALLAREWIELGDDGVVLVQPDILLQTWRENYRRPTGESITGNTHLHDTQLEERLRGTLNPHPEHPRVPLRAAFGRPVACAVRPERHPYALRRRAGRRCAEKGVEAHARREGRERGAPRPDGREPVSRLERARA